MVKYATVYFTPEEAEKQRQLRIAMNDVGIIFVKQEMIESDYQDMIKMKSHAQDQITLHDEKEVNIFENIIRVFFEGLNYTITDEPTADFKEKN